MGILNSIAVYCGSRTGHDTAFTEACDDLAGIFIEHKITMVYGGGSVGLMGKMADQLLAAQGEVIGVIPKRIDAMGVGHQTISKMHVVEDMHQRKALMEKLSDGFIALPGGVGTMEELFEIFSWSQLGYHQKPFGLLNTAGYYDTLLRFMDEMVEKGFLSAEHRHSLIVSDSPAKLFDKISNHYPQ